MSATVQLTKSAARRECSVFPARADIRFTYEKYQQRTFQAVLGEGCSHYLCLLGTDAACVNWRLTLIEHLVHAHAEPLRQTRRTRFHIITQVPHDLNCVADIGFAKSDANGR